jgi:hypothetical protein
MAFYGQQEQSAAAMRPFIGKLTSQSPAPVLDLLVCAKHLFVAATVAWVHPGCRESTNQIFWRGSPRGRGTWGRRSRPIRLLIHAALVPELAGSLGRVDAGILPLRSFIASGGLQLPAAVVASEKQRACEEP